MEGRNDEVTGFCGGERGGDCFRVAHFADENHVWILSQGGSESGEIVGAIDQEGRAIRLSPQGQNRRVDPRGQRGGSIGQRRGPVERAQRHAAEETEAHRLVGEGVMARRTHQAERRLPFAGKIQGEERRSGEALFAAFPVPVEHRGDGVLGGVVNTTTKRARFGDAIASLSVRADSEGSLRGSVDVNRQLGPAAAVRVNLLRTDERNWIQTYYNNREGAHLALTFRPWKGGEFRAEVIPEDAEGDENLLAGFVIIFRLLAGAVQRLGG